MFNALRTAVARVQLGRHSWGLAKWEARLTTWLHRRALARGEDFAWMQRHDVLTGLLNRSAFTEQVRTLRRQDVTGVIAVIDIDHFKLLNDRYGHRVSDDLLAALAARLQATMTADIVAARYGGDEFALFVPGEMDRARLLADRLLTVIRQPFEHESSTLNITASIGVAALPLSMSLDQGMSSADMAMYVAKSSGRDRVLEFSPEAQGVVTARRELAKTVVMLQESNKALQDQVQLDALTGLRSRRALDQLLDRACGGREPAAEHCAVAFLDIDHFGSYNKHHGDDRGDIALRHVAQIVQATARRGDLVFRKGGEEIVVILPGAGEDEAQWAAERMRSAVQEAAISHMASPTAPVVTITIGVASSHAMEQSTIHQVLNRAAEAAMRAKLQAQRNQVHVA